LVNDNVGRPASKGSSETPAMPSDVAAFVPPYRFEMLAVVRLNVNDSICTEAPRAAVSIVVVASVDPR
jgi:hypothetical protein